MLRSSILAAALVATSDALVAFSGGLVPATRSLPRRPPVLHAPPTMVLSSEPSTAAGAGTPLLTEITANNLKMTDGMRDHVHDKVGGVLARHKASISRCETHLTVNKNPRVPNGHCCEVVVFAKNHVIRAEERTSNMYASIDLVAHKLARKLRKLKERRKQRPHHSFRDDPDVLAKPEEEATTPVAASVAAPPVEDTIVVRRKSFPMPPQSVEDAATAIDFLDHDFYMFNNVATGKISVLYKRRDGGLGLIEPDDEE